jgi:exodeoxyribonuclease-5
MKDIKLDPASCKDNKSKKVGKDIDYGYALTIHKLQGSTMKNIAIDLHDIVYPTNNPNVFTDVDTRNRLLYVGLSRTNEKALIHY